jgi:hypothetical protein
MKESLTKIEKVVLYWVSMDYETLETIIGNVSHDADQKINSNELHNILQNLRLKGLVESYAYSTQENKYVIQAPVGQYPQNDIWWYVTSEGKELLK